MNKATKLVVALTAMLAAGCTDAALAPSSQAPETSMVGGGSNAALTGFDTLRFQFQIDPSRATTYWLGKGNSISFPAHSLCDLKSSYGPTEWDSPCAAATRPVTITARAWLDDSGHPRIDFNPSVRFVPSANPANWVILAFRDQKASQDEFYNILYCVTANAKKCTNEALVDPSLASLRDSGTGRVYRRVKHFSGYYVTADGCDPSDPNCGSTGAFERSGPKTSSSQH